MKTSVIRAITEASLYCNKLLQAIATIKAHPLPLFSKTQFNSRPAELFTQLERSTCVHIGINNKEQVCNVLQSVDLIADTEIRGTDKKN